MGYYIILRGPLGVGKTTVAKKLVEKLKGYYIGLDSVLSRRGLDKVDTEEGIPAENFIKAQEIIIPDVKDKLSKGRIVVIDACFYHKEQIEHLIENLGKDYVVVTLKASVEVCIERDKERSKVLGEDSVRAVFSLVDKFDYGLIINTDGKKADEVARKILGHLK